jgi:hypothetical protein
MAKCAEISNHRVWRPLIVAVLVGSFIHAMACIVKRPFEFGDGSRIHTFFCAGISGLLSFPLVFAALLLPMRRGLNYFIPKSTQRGHAIIGAVILLALIGTWIGVRFLLGVELPPYCHGYFWHSVFWAIFVFAVVISFYWPLASETPMQVELGSERDA